VDGRESLRRLIGIGAAVARRPLPHHRAYGSVHGGSSCFDGFSIGSNDLTQLTLDVDRDSEIVAHVFDERDKACAP
jgi:PEP-utilising enzyme, PEP-binding domain